MGRNRENFGALLKSIIGNLKSIIGSGLSYIHITLSGGNRETLRKLCSGICLGLELPFWIENVHMGVVGGCTLHLPRTLVLHMNLVLQSKPTKITCDLKVNFD